ncbi:MAG TPA: DUF5788 family protein [Methanothrix sp.]|nr:DUF5788 family protein [Methanothrix sp.]HPT18916.1 DUF5788 family protein [Methanothrix sp.]
MPSIKNDKECIGDCLTEEERKKLVASLHHALVWVGVKEPEMLEIDKADLSVEMEKLHQTEKDLPPELHAELGKVELHRLIWRLINEKEITETERQQIAELIDILEKKKKMDEDYLSSRRLSQEQAVKLHDEAASIIRSILDLRDLLKGRGREDRSGLNRDEYIRRKVDDAKRWNNFMDELKSTGGSA